MQPIGLSYDELRLNQLKCMIMPYVTVFSWKRLRKRLERREKKVHFLLNGSFGMNQRLSGLLVIEAEVELLKNA